MIKSLLGLEKLFPSGIWLVSVQKEKATNLIHWMVLHSPLTITEHHHHGHLDLFPDYGRQIPFGTGTSIHEREAYFKEELDGIYRYNKIYKSQVDKHTGKLLEEVLIIENRAKVMYDRSYIEDRLEDQVI